MVTPAELSKRITAYSEPWLGAALKAGCRSVRDLAVRYAEGKRRELVGGRKGHKSLKRRANLDFRRLRDVD